MPRLPVTHAIGSESSQENYKDMIKHCMIKHEALVRKLAESPLGGPRFTSFIRRWEMNNEPLPQEAVKPEKYALRSFFTIFL